MSDQAKVFMPEFRTEGFGAAILSSRLSGVGKSVGFLYFEERTDPRIKRLSQVLQRNNLQVIREGTLGTGHAVFLPPGLHLGRRQWAALGVPEFRLQTQQFYHDLSSPASLKQLQDRAFADLGVKPENVAARRIASNRYMQDVFDGILGRAIVQNGTWHAEWEPGKDGRRKGEARPDSFMRGITAESFSGSARGIAMMIANGEKFDNPRMNLLYSAIIASAPHLSDTPGFRRLDLNEEVEGQLATLITPVGRRADNIHDFNISLDSNLAAHQERNGTRLKLQQFSTPFPIARSAFDVLLPQDGDRLLEPTIGNGTLVSSFLGRNIDITGVELDPARAGRSGRLLESATVIEGDFVKEAASLGLDFDMFVANPPFENLETNQLVHDRLGSRMTLRRLDHQIAYEGLQRLKPEGRAFLVLPGDMITNGALDGARRFWDNYLRQTYHVAGSACVDGRLYRKMGAEFPVLLYALGPMRDVPLSTEELRDLEVEALPLLVTHDELLSWADVTRERMIELTGLPSTEPGYTDQGRVQREPAAAVASRPSSPPVASLPKHGNDASDGAVASEYPGTPSKTAGKPRSQTAQPAGSAVEPNEIPEAVADPAPIPPDGQEPTASGIPATAITLVDDTEDDVFVRSYEPFSNCGEAQTKIQKSLQGLTYRALIDVEAKHGDVDDFVASKLNIPVSELGKRFSPEQVDGAALAFARKMEGRGFLFADLMGVGKGRELGMMAMAAFAEDRPVIFWSEQPNLFTDFVARDLCDVYATSADEMKKQGHIRPFIFNQSPDAAIRDEHGKPLYGVGDTKTAKRDGISTDHNMVLATYSQVQTVNGIWKVDAILEWARGQAQLGKKPELILDEVHKAAGEASNTGVQIERLVDGIKHLGGTITYSSATPLKSGKNIRIYSPILPDTGMDAASLTALIEGNPLALQEVLSGEMARMGTMISREVDSSGAIRTFVSLEELDPTRHATIVQAVDRAAMLLRELVEMAPEIDRAAALMGSRYSGGGGGAAAKVNVQTTSPVAQFHTFSQYLMVAVKSVYDQDLILDAIAAGTKPVVVVENTGKEVLSRLANRIGETQIEDGLVAKVISRLPNIGDVLIENASKLLDVKITDPTGNEIHLRLEEYEAWLDRFTENVEAARLDLLTLDPIDRIKAFAAKHDLSVGEITKRSLEAEPRPDGSYAVVSRKIVDKREIIRDFNNGDVDIVVMNRSAASGVSMHASPSVGVDLRPRRMIKLQLQSEITAERQIDGRIQRYGQVHDGQYVVPMSGFAADDRLCQLFNRKNRSLTATSNATRENRSNIDEAADLMNPVGEGAVRQYLNENPHIAVQLDLPIPNEGGGSEIDSYARRLMGRLVCLPIKMQETVLSEIDTLFRMHIDALDARGLNPLKLNQHDWKATLEPVATLIAGNDAADSMGKRPLNLVKLKYQETVEPLSFATIEDHLERGERNLVDEEMGRYVSPSEMIGQLFKLSGEPEWSAAAWDRTMNRRSEDRSLGLDEISNEEASAIWQRRATIDLSKASVNEKRIIRAISYADFVQANIEMLEPGNFVQFDTTLFPAMKDSRIALEMARVLDKEIRFVPGLITRVQFRPTDPLNLSAWKLDVASPGQTHVDTVGLTGAFGVLADMTSEERKEAFPGHETPRYAFTVSAIGVYGEFLDSKPEYASQHLTPYIYGDRHAANIADIKIPRYLENPIQYLSTRNEGFRDFIRHAFDDAPAGQVKRERYALDGNMFQAVKISQGKQRLGEKAIYTTSSGEVRHGVILKNENVSKLIGKLESNVAALSVPLDKTHPELIQSFIDVYRRISTLNDLGYAYSNYGQIDSRAREYLVNDLATLFSDGLDTPGVYDYADKHLLSIVNDMRKAMSSKAVSEVYVGSDVFIEAGTDISKTQTIERECFQDTHKKWVEVKTGFSPLGLATHAKGIGGDDLHLVFAGSTSVLLFHKKSELVAKAGGDMELLDRGTNKIDKAKLTKGVLATSSFRTEDVARLLHVVAKESSSNIMVRGPIAGVQGALTLHHAKAHEFAVDLALKNGNRRLEM
ncbi:strawberry notch C-terminal domain-containing protein (plasmid) [Allorhizobium sp. Av2]|nr:hypothetical protein [Allorhizobium sp. Av2]